MDNEPSEHPDVRYERKDIRLGRLLGLIVAAICVLVGRAVSGIWRLLLVASGAPSRRSSSRPIPWHLAIREIAPRAAVGAA